MEMKREDIAEGVAEAKQTIRDTARKIRAGVKDAGTRLVAAGREAARAGLDRADEFVHERPLTTIAVAAASAFVVGWVLGWVMKRD